MTIKLKKLLVILFIPVLLLSCKKSKDQPEAEPEFPAVVSGKLYGVPISAKAVIERRTNFSMAPYTPETLVAIYISTDEVKGCDKANSEFQIRLSAPRKLGKYSGNDTYIMVEDPRDPTGVSGALFSSEETIIEITKISGDKVTGTVDVKWAAHDIAFRGKFEASICQ